MVTSTAVATNLLCCKDNGLIKKMTIMDAKKDARQMLKIYFIKVTGATKF